ncbi:MAG: hypothetical protein L6Q54_15780 [Leptospiraceae bacterium]|nr:hypothetical protein [Leptospiraceae bacterium]MCK6382696.1 hypothetical protein [Leptospiraceae bacterium]
MSFVYLYEKSIQILEENSDTSESVKLLIEELLRTIRRYESDEDQRKKEDNDSISIKRIKGK